MNSKILKLAKRLNKFTFDEISLISESEEQELEEVLNELESSGYLRKSSDLYIFIPPKTSAKRQIKLPQKFQYHPKETIEMIIKCFCAEIEPEKASKITEPQKSCIYNFYQFFRELLYNVQKEEFLKYYERQPKIACSRTFFEKTVYFFFYENQLFVINNIMKKTVQEKHSDDETKRLKILYSRVKRCLDKWVYVKFLHYHIAERIWRNEKSFEQLERELKSYLGFY